MHPVHALRLGLFLLIPIGIFLPYFSTRRLRDACFDVAQTIESVWGLLYSVCILFLVCDVVGAGIFASGRRKTGSRWWGGYEKTVVRGTVFLLWAYCGYMIYSYGTAVYNTKFRCWTGPIVVGGGLSLSSCPGRLEKVHVFMISSPRRLLTRKDHVGAGITSSSGLLLCIYSNLL